jgi:putative ABC transport system ATP-binding protein
VLQSELAASCAGVVKIYWSASGEVHALKGVDARFPAGEVTSVVGPSGSGKSSFLRILAGLERPTAGSVQIGGEEFSNVGGRRLRTMRRRRLGYVFQRPSDNLIPYLTVMEHLQMAARFRGLRAVSGAGELLESLGLEGREHHRPGQLSGGEQQRVAFAQAVVGEPALVVADEPTAELDGESGRALMEAVTAQAGRGSAFVISTHDPAVVAEADRVLTLRHGALEAETTALRALSVIDASGRIQLPPAALDLFPDRRATIEIVDGELRITPP